MQLRLTYQGPLLGANGKNTRAKHKHEIRKCFHRQLKRFWEIHPALAKASLQDGNNPAQYYMILPYLSEKFSRYGYSFVPLVSALFTVNCSISVLLLRPDPPGQIIRSGDIDNRLKTVFDALRVPQTKDELGGYQAPDDDEHPMFCLLEDDKLIHHVSLETDTLLEPVSQTGNDNDVRVIVKADIQPYFLTRENSVFG